tara:strand:- start:12627 stop:13118 length:492 start_codon:yes stop_codon:yes gene_type:complete
MNNKILSKEELLLKSLSDYFYNNNKFNKIIDIITGNSEISLRTIDWFVTNYSQKYNIICNINNKNINIYNSYKNQLRAFNKRFFDPFCRINKNNMIKRIIFKYNDEQYIETTIGQINFFKWALEYNIISYIENNYINIYNDLNNKNLNSKILNNNYNFKVILT